VLFLGDHAYGVAAQVTEATEQALTVELAVSLAEPHVPGALTLTRLCQITVLCE